MSGINHLLRTVKPLRQPHLLLTRAIEIQNSPTPRISSLITHPTEPAEISGIWIGLLLAPSVLPAWSGTEIQVSGHEGAYMVVKLAVCREINDWDAMFAGAIIRQWQGCCTIWRSSLQTWRKIRARDNALEDILNVVAADCQFALLESDFRDKSETVILRT
jgi:hypothetical protein